MEKKNKNTANSSTSVLFSLQPMGYETTQIESLTSYMIRLAEAHSIKVNDLILFCRGYANLPEVQTTPHKLVHINGMVESSRIWSQIIAKLTLNPLIRFTTMWFWQGILGRYQVLKHKHAWCEACLFEWYKSRTTLYEPLLWHLQIAQLCPIHCIPLSNICFNCKQSFPAITTKRIVGYCPKCSAFLGRENHRKVFDIPDCAKLEVSHAAYLIPSAHTETVKEVYEYLPNIVQYLKEKLNSSGPNMSKLLGIGQTTFSELLGQHRKPNTHVMVRLLNLLSEHNLLNSSGNLHEEIFTISKDTLTPYPTNYNDTEISTYLRMLLSSPERLPDIRDINKKYNFKPNQIKFLYPDLYHKLRERSLREMAQFLKEQLNKPSDISLRKRATVAGYSPQNLSYNFPELYKEISQKIAQDKYARCAKYLAQILQDQENNITTLHAISLEVNVDRGYLKRKFPNEVALLQKQWEARRKKEINRVGKLLEEELAKESTFEPKSLKMFSEEIGQNTDYLKRHFPEYSSQLLKRYESYLENQVIKHCKQIRNTVFELHKQGIYPGMDQLHAATNVWLIRGTSYREAYVKAMQECGYKIDS